MLGTGELIVILCIVLLLFGGKKLPEVAKSLGQGIREFKKAAAGEESSSGSCGGDCGSCPNKEPPKKEE